MASIAFGTIAGARLYFVLQNDFTSYVSQPWRLLAVWEGGLAFFVDCLEESSRRTFIPVGTACPSCARRIYLHRQS